LPASAHLHVGVLALSQAPRKTQTPSHVKPPVVLAKFQHCVLSLASAMRDALPSAMVGSEKTSAGPLVQLQLVSGAGVASAADEREGVASAADKREGASATSEKSASLRALRVFRGESSISSAHSQIQRQGKVLKNSYGFV
jgi:hypothetical protein